MLNVWSFGNNVHSRKKASVHIFGIFKINNLHHRVFILHDKGFLTTLESELQESGMRYAIKVKEKKRVMQHVTR